MNPLPRRTHRLWFHGAFNQVKHCRCRCCNTSIHTAGDAEGEPIRRLRSYSSLLSAKLQPQWLETSWRRRSVSHFGGQFNLVDPVHTCRSSQIQRIDSSDVLLLSQAFDVGRVFICPRSRPLLSYSVSHRPPRATTPLWQNYFPISATAADLHVPPGRRRSLSSLIDLRSRAQGWTRSQEAGRLEQQRPCNDKENWCTWRLSDASCIRRGWESRWAQPSLQCNVDVHGGRFELLLPVPTSLRIFNTHTSNNDLVWMTLRLFWCVCVCTV